MTDIFAYLRTNPYPGRGILLGLGENHRFMIAYFIMGRSGNSRNRVFERTADGIITSAADLSKVKDPSLILYTPVRMAGSVTIVSNGDQTDTIYQHLKNGDTFESALRTRTFEPDAPNYTPRISGMVTGPPDFSYRLSILKSNGSGEVLERQFFEYPKPSAGTGRFLCTYRGDGDPLPGFAGEPVAFDPGKINACDFAAKLWDNLNHENRISLYVKTISLSGDVQTEIINQYKKV